MIRWKYWETCLTGVVTDDNVPSRWVPGGVLAIQKVIETGLLRFLHGFAFRNFRITLSSIRLRRHFTSNHVIPLEEQGPSLRGLTLP